MRRGPRDSVLFRVSKISRAANTDQRCGAAKRFLPLAIIAEDEVIGATLVSVFSEAPCSREACRLHPRIHPRIRDLVGKNVDELIMSAADCEFAFLAEPSAKLSNVMILKSSVSNPFTSRLRSSLPAYSARLPRRRVQIYCRSDCGPYAGVPGWRSDCGQEAGFVRCVGKEPGFPLIFCCSGARRKSPWNSCVLPLKNLDVGFSAR